MSVLRLIHSIALLMLFAIGASAEDLFVSQSGAGSANGTSAANAWSVASLNTAGNWGVGAGKVSPGDVVRLVAGDITNQITVQASGTAGNPITILFEAGAKMTKARWSTAGSGSITFTEAAILVSGKDYIHIDGSNSVNTVGIEATDTGTAGVFTHQDYNVGVLFYGGSTGSDVRNLTVTNMYRRTPNSTDADVNGSSIQFRGGQYVSCGVSNVSVWQNNVGIYLGWSGATSDFYVLNSRGGDAGEGVVVTGCELPGSSCPRLTILGCNFRDQRTWTGNGAAVHLNLIHLHTGATTNSPYIDTLIGESIFTGTGSTNGTSFVYLEGTFTNALLRNVLFAPTDTTFTGNGYLFFKGPIDPRVINCTWVTPGHQGNGIAISEYSSATNRYDDRGLLMSNCWFRGIAFPIYDDIGAIAASARSGIDYNVYDATTGQPQFKSLGTVAQGSSYTQWRDGFPSYDANSSTNSVTYSGYTPTAGDSVAKATGFNWSSLFTTDLSGAARPSTGPWTIGAAQFFSMEDSPNQPKVTLRGSVTIRGAVLR